MTTRAWIVIVPDGDTPEVPRRDLRRVGDRPLITWAIAAALEAADPDRVVVLTADAEVEEVATFAGAHVVRHREELGRSDDEPVLEVHASWPFVSPDTLRRALELLDDHDTVISVRQESRPVWRRADESGWYAEPGPALIEIPAFRGTRGGGDAVAFVELHGREALEIRGFDDLEAARHWVQQLSIVVRTDAARELGMGHVYRSLALAQELAPHRLLVVTSDDKPLGREFFEQTPFDVVAVADDDAFFAEVVRADADLVILDILDTGTAFIAALRAARPGVKVVSFEDHGPGAHDVDLLVCDIYENPAVPHDRQLVGIEHALLAPTFETVPRTSREPADVDEVLVLFGGTDPSGLAVKSLHALEAIAFPGHVTVVRGLGAVPLDVGALALDVEVRVDVANMAELMSTADLALSSAGRTLAELATIGVPTLCMAQNAKELRHTHSTVEHGVVMLGLGTEVSDVELQTALRDLIADRERRSELRAAALAVTRTRRNATVVDEILHRTGAGR